MVVMPVLKTVFWDVDGTLADTEMDGHRPAFNRAFVEQGLNWTWDPETYKRLLSIPGGSLRMKTFAQQRGEVLSDAQFAQLRVSKQSHYLDAVRAGAVSLRPGVERLLRELQARGIDQWIVTSSGAPSVSALLDTLFPGGDHPFAGVISANDVSRHKPRPEPYLKALECSNTDPESSFGF
jgi:beta-phosphoglucomutase-like phosphatase (HAD superfamily)